ncbi:hypothetical protein BV898_09859 [Hypsibius exemplaris]|uniref:F-box domain-containing protein n=1 Tax=Hypsibius exemplaris TaxID=2072580 RepID=A0A1W0WL58_HYPEX|nr:hypothetical protein BV898_09859 [Hypsibius exemplaris]
MTSSTLLPSPLSSRKADDRVENAEVVSNDVSGAFLVAPPIVQPIVSVDIKWVPWEDLKDLFRFCDLPTHCKLRRISQLWKYLVSLEGVNEVFKSSSAGTVVVGLFGEGDERANFEGHRRNVRVRAIIFRSKDTKEDFSDLTFVKELRSIGMYYTEVLQIVLHRADCCWARRDDWSEVWDGDPLSLGFPWLHSFSLVDCRGFFPAYDFFQTQFRSPMKFEIDFLVPRMSIDWHGELDKHADYSLDAFIWSTIVVYR